MNRTGRVVTMLIAASALGSVSACDRHEDPVDKPDSLSDGQPRISFVSVPAWGSTENLEGRVWGVEPADFKVAVYIFVEPAGGWWTKPTFASPLTPITGDSTWTTSITTGGNDSCATRIMAFLVPNGFAPPPCGACGNLPSSPFDHPYVVTGRLPGTREVDFSGYRWVIKKSDQSIGKVGPGGPVGNYFSDDPQDVWVDADGMHLTITKKNDEWFCTEAILDTSLGYGTYVMDIVGQVDAMDSTIVMGFFTWDDIALWDATNPNPNYREIDIEFSTWRKGQSELNAQFVVQPHEIPGNRHRFHMEIPEDRTSHHTFEWKQQTIRFQSVSGVVTEDWVYAGGDIPSPGGENVRLNLWLIGGEAPASGEDTELIVRRFEFFPSTATGVDRDVTDRR